MPPVNGLEGSSFVRLLDDPEQQWKKAAFSQIKRADTIIGLNVSTNRYRYNSWGTMGEELYDHLNDPKQYINLVSNLAYTTVLNDMRKLLADGWTKTTPPPCTSFKLYADKDADGYGSLSDSLRSCYKPWNYVENYNDCDDTNADVHPTAAEICNNGIDDNCNGLVDENAPVARITALGDTNICVTGAVTLKATQRDGYAFQWRKGNNNIPNERKRYFTATSPGIYRVAVRDSAGCIALSNSIKVVDANCISAGIKNSVDELNLSNDRQTVFPNPSKGNVSVNYYSIHNGSVQLQVFDAGGKLVLSKKVAAVSGTNIFSLTLGHLANGTYFLDIGSPESHFRSLVIIDK